MSVLSMISLMIRPEIGIALFALMSLIVGIFSSCRKCCGFLLFWTIILSLIAYVLCFMFNILSLYNSILTVDLLSEKSSCFLILLTIFIILGLYVLDYKKYIAEILFLVLCTLLGSLLMVSAQDFLMMYLGLELQSLCMYILITLKRDNIISVDAGLKYFILAALSSGILLYGISIIYTFYGEISFIKLYNTLYYDHGNYNNMLHIVLGFGMVIIGLLFKISIVPFHVWVPDVYRGSSFFTISVISTLPKIASVVVLIRIVHILGSDLFALFSPFLYSIALFSMLFAALSAIYQVTVKKLLAYSGIGHMSFVLLAITSGHNQYALLYVFVYTITVIGMVSIFIRRADSEESIMSMSGMFHKFPFQAICFAVFLLSAAGIPPSLGFFSKLFVIFGIVENGYNIVAILTVLFTVISAYYYLRVIVYMFFHEMETCLVKMHDSKILDIISFFVVATILFVALLPHSFIPNIGHLN